MTGARRAIQFNYWEVKRDKNFYFSTLKMVIVGHVLFDVCQLEIMYDAVSKIDVFQKGQMSNYTKLLVNFTIIV